MENTQQKPNVLTVMYFRGKQFLEFQSKLHSHIKGLGPKGGMSSPQVHLEKQARQV